MNESPNPYESPQADAFDDIARDSAALPRPPYKLFTVGHVVLATFLGSPAAGGVILAINYHRLGRGAAVWHAAGWSLLATALLLAFATVGPDLPVGSSAYWVPQLLGMYFIANSLQGQLLTEHRAKQGRLSSAWLAAGVGIGVGVAVLAAYVVVLFALLIAFPDAFPEEEEWSRAVLMRCCYFA